MNVFAPSFLATTSDSDIVGFNIVASDHFSQSRIASFGQTFKEGQINSLESLQASINGETELVQVDPKTFYSDGSLQFAVLSFRQPDVGSGQTIQGMLRIKASQGSAQAVDVLNVIAGHSAKINIDFGAGGLVTDDLLSIVKAAVLNGTASTWQHGPLVTQIRISIPIQDSLRLLTTVTAFSDGTFSIGLGFNNDGAMAAQGGAKTYSASLSVDGSTTLQTGQITQAQYQNWNTTVWGGGGQASSTIIQHDPAYLEQAGAIPTFDLGNGVADYKIASYSNEMEQPSWEQPLSNNGVEKLMPTTGARPDIGITTEPTAVWLITQDPTAAKYAIGQADASGAVPWNFWNAQAGTWLNTDQYSNIWVDGRGGTSDGGSVGLTQQVSSQTGWDPDTSHQPDLSYYAYLMTGDHKYLDSLNAQASNTITSTWEAYRGTQQLVVGYDQIRASAWNLRQVDEAAWANPVDSAEGKYFSKISDANWKWLVDQIPNWTAKQGEAYGQVEGYAWGSRSYSRPWMQDYFASVAAEAARHGNANAMTFLKWESNFLVGRFLNGANGFNPRDGVAYTLAMGPNDSDGNIRFQTWAEIGKATVAAGESNGSGWGNSIGDYGALGLVSLADIISVTGSTDAIKAYNFLITSGAPFTSLSDLAQSNQLNIKPDLPNGWTFAADRTIVQKAISEPSSTGSAPGSSGKSDDQVNATPTAQQTVLTVGVGKQFATINAAVQAANQMGGNADIKVDAGIYTNDGGYLWDGINNVTIEGVGGVATVVDPTYNAGGKAAIVTGGRNILLKNLDISGVTVPDGNGAGVRYDQGSLTLDNVHLHNNQNGILGAADATGSVTIVHSEIDHNGTSAGNTHNIYIGNVAQFTLTSSYIHDASVGHEVKSRAENNTITDNRIFDNGGTSSYAIDLPNGGNALITGNIIEQGINNQNHVINAYGEEGSLHAGISLDFSSNIVVNDDPQGRGPLWSSSGAIIMGSANTVWNIADLGADISDASTTQLVNRPTLDLSSLFTSAPSVINNPTSTNSSTIIAPTRSTPSSTDPTTPPPQELSSGDSNLQPSSPFQSALPPSTSNIAPETSAPSPISSVTNGSASSINFGQTGNTVPNPNSTMPINPSSDGRTEIVPAQPVVQSPEISQATYRFFDKINGTQFLTSSEAERDTLMRDPSKFTYEGHGMNSVAIDLNNPNVASVFRFFNSTSGTHFFTTSDIERNSILASRPDLIQEQANFAEHIQAEAGDSPVYRFFDAHSGDHFFTQSPLEFKTILSTRPDMINEGVAFYAPS